MNQIPFAPEATAIIPRDPATRYHRLFCYGTLQVPSVLEAVIGHRLRSMRAVLPGYAAYQVRRAEYPGLIRSTGNKTPGRLYLHVTPEELHVLDRFEGPLYHRRHRVVINDSGRRIQAWVYMVAFGRQKQVSARPWQLERFMRTDYRRFMRRFVEDRRILFAPQTS